MFEELNTFLHLLATTVWIGGMIFMHFILKPASRQIDPAEAGKMQGIVAKRFTIAAWSSLIVLIITGLIKTPSDMLFDFSFLALTLKHILIIAAIIVGLIITLVIVPKLKASAPVPGQRPSDEFNSAQKNIDLLSSLNTLIGVIILILASMLW